MSRHWFPIATGLALLLGPAVQNSKAIPPPKIDPNAPAGDATPGAPPAQKPIGGISLAMTGVAGDLTHDQTGPPVQAKETKIVQDLDTLIAQLEKECSNCRGIKKNNPSKPAKDSVISGGTGGIGTLVEPGGSGKDWAKLSGRERDRILQSMSEGFPPEYRTVLERYYRRLAEEKAAPAPGAAAPAKGEAAKDDAEAEFPAPADQP